MIRKAVTALAVTLIAAIGAVGTPEIATAQTVQRGPLDSVREIYGAVADPNNPGQLLLGSQYGLLRASPDGMVALEAGLEMAVSAIAGQPGGAELFLSGLSPDGQPAGILISRDGGTSWNPLPGTGGEQGVMLTSLAVDPANGQRLIGLSRDIMLSEDGGQSWQAAVSTPAQTFSAAYSASGRPGIFAATMQGLMVSRDNGASWRRSYEGEQPATAIAALGDGRLIGFVFGLGVIVSSDDGAGWQLAADGFEGRYVVSFSEGPDGVIYAIADTGAILMSRDGGAGWISFEGSHMATPDAIAAGEALFAANCQVCHGVGAIGEDPANPGAQDAFGFKAPALNDDMHGWHHSDAGLLSTIGKGSPRNERMIAWQEVLSEQEMAEILAYIKSLWSINSLACQGARHMNCQ